MRCLRPAASVFRVLLCIPHIDLGEVLLSCFYVPHWYVCLYALGLIISDTQVDQLSSV
jgi:hypothetical protein